MWSWLLFIVPVPHPLFNSLTIHIGLACGAALPTCYHHVRELYVSITDDDASIVLIDMYNNDVQEGSFPYLDHRTAKLYDDPLLFPSLLNNIIWTGVYVGPPSAWSLARSLMMSRLYILLIQLINSKKNLLNSS